MSSIIEEVDLISTSLGHTCSPLHAYSFGDERVRSFRFNLSFLFVYVLCFFSPTPLFFPPSPPLSLHLPPLTISALHCGMLYSMEFNTRCGPLKTSQPPKLKEIILCTLYIIQPRVLHYCSTHIHTKMKTPFDLK